MAMACCMSSGNLKKATLLMEPIGIHQGSNENQNGASTLNEIQNQNEASTSNEIQNQNEASTSNEIQNQGSNENQNEASTSNEIQNQNEASTSNEIQNQNQNQIQIGRLVDELKIMVGKAGPSVSMLPVSNEWRIRRIPGHLRQVKEQAYTPTTISIGPIHHRYIKSEMADGYKSEFFKNFLKRTPVKLEAFVSAISGMEVMIRSCYEEDTVSFINPGVFVKMILVDAVFILELLLGYSESSREMNKLFVTGQLRSIKSDLVLLENQLPFFVLDGLYGLAFTHCSSLPSLVRLISIFFEYCDVEKFSTGDVEVKHLTDLLRAFQLPPSRMLVMRFRETSTSSVMREMMFNPLTCSATQLYDAGVKFKKSPPSKRLLDLHFKKGVLEIPRLDLDDLTEVLVRNVMALEQFGYWNVEIPSFTDYFIFLDSLINTVEDINLLCDRGILVYRLGDNREALSLVKSLITNITWSGMSSDFTEICKGLNKFYQKPVHRWKAILSVTTLKNQYFSNPWRGAATTAAFLLLLLTLIQTIMSVLQVVRAYE